MDVIKFLLIIFSTILGSIVNAQDLLVGSYLDCRSVKAYRLWSTSEKYEQESDQLFIVRIDEKTLEFISNSAAYNAGIIIKKEYHQPHLLSGYDTSVTFSLDRQLEGNRFRFHFSSTMSSHIFTMFGYCKKLDWLASLTLSLLIEKLKMALNAKHNYLAKI